MEHLLYKKQGKNVSIIRVIFILLTSVLFFTSCSQSAKVDLPQTPDLTVKPEDREWMTKFFKDLLIEESAIYTLWGSKPVTIADVYYYPQEEIDAWVASFSAEEKKSWVYKEDPSTLHENWEKWERISSQYPMTKYLLFKRPCPLNAKIHEIFFVDILKTALTIERYHETFSRITNLDFDALEVVFEIQDEESEFWNEVYDSCVLTGILLGFGEKNAWCFNWRHWTDKDFIYAEAMEFADALPYRFQENHKNYAKVSISHFPIPSFASFSPEGEDEVIIKYQNERKQIQEIYRNKDFLECTLQRLMH